MTQIINNNHESKGERESPCLKRCHSLKPLSRFAIKQNGNVLSSQEKESKGHGRGTTRYPTHPSNFKFFSLQNFI